MIILGLGSNLGDRKRLLKQAIKLIAQINHTCILEVSPYYQSDAMLLPNADPAWNMPYLNCAVAINTTLSPHEILKEAKNIEAHMGRKFGARWSPRPIDIDILKWHNLSLNTKELTIPHIGLLKRPFALLPLNDLEPSFAFETAQKWRTGTAPFNTIKVDTLDPTWVGILNLTPDSFSDGGNYQNREAILNQINKLICDGAKVIDVGAESTRPQALGISSELEWQRLKDFLPLIIEKVHKEQLEVSLDTYHFETVKKAYSLGIDWINDISGLADKNFLNILVEAQTKNMPLKYVLTFNRSCNEADDIIAEAIKFAKEKFKLFKAEHINLENIIFDPGLGFNKSLKQNFEILSRAAELHILDCPLLFGHSRKSFIKHLTNSSNLISLDAETANQSKLLINKGIDYLRVHNIIQTSYI